MTNYTAHIDTFARDALPALDQQADCLFNLESLQFPERLNCAVELLDRNIERGLADRIAIQSADLSWTYRQLFEITNRIANVLRDDLGLVPGNRVLLRAPNNPMMAACWLAVVKAGGIVVATMPLLRARDLEPIINKAKVRLALCDSRLQEELVKAQDNASCLETICLFSASADIDAGTELEQRMQTSSTVFSNIETASDDVAIIAFTSGTTGQPKGTMHFHRDVMAMCVCVGDELVKPSTDDVFIGSPPLAFTFGMGMSLALPLYAGAATTLVENPTPDKLSDAIECFKATICATAPTAYRAMMKDTETHNFSSLKKTVSAGEHLPLSTRQQWEKLTGIKMIDGLGASEMLHIFISAAGDDIRPGAIGKAIPGYQCCILDDDNHPLPAGAYGKLAVNGPTSCKYLADERQADYVVDGWNITGDICYMDEDGYVFYQGRSDDMIISAGYNISGAEVESALLGHDAISECAVVSATDFDRGAIVKAFVVLNSNYEGSDKLVKTLQDFVKQAIAPYKYPRAIEFVSSLPKTQTGKIQRHKLRN